MQEESGKFAVLFKKYRLKAEFSTLSELGLALSEKGLNYEESIFSHWQKGTRIPQSRHIILTLIEIFIQRKALTTVAQANELLCAAHQGYLSEEEQNRLLLQSHTQIFQVPNEIANFCGREEIIENILRADIQGKVLLLHGPAGVGKTALAIKLGHLLKDRFPDGVLWFRLDTSDIMDILLAIGYSFGKDISHIKDKEIRSTIVQSILTEKKVLLILDNAEQSHEIRLLLPNTDHCSVIITSGYASLSLTTDFTSIHLAPFSPPEALDLFKSILDDKYFRMHKKEIGKLAEKSGYLPLVMHLFANELKQQTVTIQELLERMDHDQFPLDSLQYGNKNLHLALNLSFQRLNKNSQKIFLSLSVFNGKDFSVDAVSVINEMPLRDTRSALKNLKTVSLIEESTTMRYRIHPLVKKFLRRMINDPSVLLRAARYYIRALASYDARILKSYPHIKQESDNVLYIFKKCYELHHWNEVIALWSPLDGLLHSTNQLNKIRYMYQIVKTEKMGMNMFQKMLIVYFVFLIIFCLTLNAAGLKTGTWNYIYNLSFGLVPFIGGIHGLFISKSWDLWRSSVGRALLFLSVGLFSWGTGNMIWSYYNFFLGIAAPYPSWADLGYLPFYILCPIGIMNLPHLIGGKYQLKETYQKLFLIIIPLFVVTFSYYLMVLITKSTFVFSASTSSAKLFFDIAYPTSDAIILTSALLLGISFKFFGGKYSLSMYAILLGFCFQYAGDFLFSYTTTNGSYFNGNMADLGLTIGLSLITFGVLGFHSNWQLQENS